VNKRVLITTPFPTLDEVAKELGISKSRQKKLENLVEEIIAARTRVDKLRKTYGEDFGQEVRGDAKLETLLERTGYESLSDYLRHRRSSADRISKEGNEQRHNPPRS
jgi:hypothetical protein